MLTCYDLYDLHAVLVAIRAYPTDPAHVPALIAILDVLDPHPQDTCHDLNRIRTAVAHALWPDDTTPDTDSPYIFCATENVYTHFPAPPLKHPPLYALLRTACAHLLCVLQARNQPQSIALADCLHNLPLLLAANPNRLPRHFWKLDVKAYRTAWEPSFLLEEEKQLR